MVEMGRFASQQRILCSGKIGNIGLYPVSTDMFVTSTNLLALPGTIAHFFKRCTMTRDLLDLVIELRPSHTSMGLAGNIKGEAVSSDATCFTDNWFRVTSLGIQAEDA
jgi:hypothetical protein